MTKTDIGIYRGLKEKFDPEVHIGFFITTDTGELLLGDQSLGQAIVDWAMEDGLLTLKLNTGEDIRVTFPEASETAKGLLSAADKAQLNALADNLDSKVDKVTGKSLVADSEIAKLGGLPNSTELTNSIATAKASGDNAQSDLNAHKQNTSNPHSVTKAQVGLGNVTNDAQVKRSEMGVANGVATLDEDGKVPAAQLPSYVDDIIDVYATYTKSTTGVLSNVVLYSDAAKTKLVTGEAGKIYQNIADGEPNYQFRWTGTVFSQTGASSLIIGDIAGTAYDGAKGKANADNIDKIKSTSLTHINDTTPVTTTADKVSLNYECYEGTQYGSTGTSHTADVPAATRDKAGVMSAADKTKLEGLEAGAQVNTVTSVAGKTGAVTLAKADVGLGNVDNTSDANKPVSTAQATAIADAKKAGTDAQAALDTYKTANDAAVKKVSDDLADHKAEKDKKHIPEGGHERQILAWKADGTAKWDDLANMFTGLEELLAYGVEWKDNVGDPHLTRIGNMSLHKTLPIQSQLKGCIAQRDKVIYWLDEEDWRFRKDPAFLEVSDLAYTYVMTEPTEEGEEEETEEVESTTMTVTSLTGIAVGQYIRVGEVKAKITAIDADALTITVDADIPEETTKVELGSRLDGYHGTVRVYCPNFYIKSQIIGNTRRVWLSTVKIDNTWVYQHEILLDAYRSTVLNTAGATLVANDTIEAESYLASLPANSAISVVNTAAYCRGGNNNDNYDKYLDTDPFRTLLGKPKTSMARSTMRTYSRNAGSEMINYNQYKNIFYWLYVVEYANFNCQEVYNAELTAEGYHQGGMGAGVTNWNSTHWGNYNGYYPLTPCGYTNEFGNGTGVKPFTTVAGTNNLDAGKTAIPEVTSVVPRWRGFENPFGDIWTNLDGVVIKPDVTSGPSKVYVTDDPAEYSDVIGNKTVAGTECPGDGYIKLFDLGETAEIIPSANGRGASTTQYKCDYHSSYNVYTKLRTLLVGGRANDGGSAGLGNFFSGNDVSILFANFGFRSVSSFLSFSDSEG